MSDRGGGLLGGEYPPPPLDHSGGGSSSGGSGVTVHEVPGGGRVISWQEPNPNYDPSQPDIMALYKITPYTTKTQFVSDPNAGSGASAYAQTQENARSAAALAEEARQFNERFGMDKARGDQTQQLAQAQALGYFNGQPTLDAQKFGFDQFKYLSDLKNNPRNFMQQFDILRGFAPHPGSAAFGTNGNLPGYGLSTGGYALPEFAGGIKRSIASGAPVTANANPRAGGAFTPGLYGSAANPNPMPTPVRASAPITELRAGATTPNIPGQYFGPTGAGAPGQQFRGVQGQAIAFNAHADQDITGAPGGLDQPKFFAHGGITPEPITGRGDWSGQLYKIGEQGPEGVVPASYLPKFLQQRHGQQGRYAVGGELGFDPGAADPMNYDPYKPMTGTPPPYGTDAPPPPPSPYDAPQLTAGDTSGGGFTVMPKGVGFSAPANPLPIPGVVQPSGAPTPSPTPMPTPSAPAPTNSYQPETPEAPPVGYVPPGAAAPAGPRTPTPSGGSVPTPVTTPPPAPEDTVLAAPQPSNNFNAGGVPAPGTLTPRDVAPAGTFGSVVGGATPFAGRDSLSTFRSYLPTFLAGEDTPLANLVNQGILPPFLGRVFAQNHGATEFGTNQPQKFNLPADVPLISRLAYTQMIPSERAAFQSYLSSYGIDPTDYFDYVNSVSPQGPSAREPLFGTPFALNIGQR